MELYTVRDIAKMLSVNEETVRRWIREGKLDAERGNGRQGSKVSDTALKRFLQDNKGLMTSSSVSTLGMLDKVGGIESAIAMPILGSFVGSNLIKKMKSKNQDKQNVKIELMEEEYKLEQEKAQLNIEIYRLQSEVELIDSKIKKIRGVIEDIDKEIANK